MEKNKRNFKPKDDKYEDKSYVPNSQGRPPVEDGHDHNVYIDKIALKDLPFSSYGVKVDPYTDSNNPTTPYHLINRFNPVLGGRFRGTDNLSGGNLVQYNSSVGSKFLKVFDSALIAIGLNYNYLPILATDTSRGGLLVDEMRKAISEVVSSLSATTFKDQNIYRYAIDTDLPMGSAVKHSVQIDPGDPGATPPVPPTTITAYTDIADVIYAFCMEYQLILQNYVMVFNMFNAHRSRMGTMINMSWNREVAALNSFFGLLKKKSFLAMFDSFALNLQGEYIDNEFMRQANTITMVASRRSDDLNDPLLEIATYINMPSTYKMYICSDSTKTEGTLVWDFADMKYMPSGASANITFEEAVKTLCLRCTVNDTLAWARTLATNQVNENDRYNEMVRCLNVLTYCMNIFKPGFEDLRTILTIMSRIGVVRWQLGTRLMITKATDCKITNYLVVNNIYELALSGAEKVIYNNTTKRWRTFTLWNIYYGTPEYSNKSGGIFLSMSCKAHDIGSYTDTNIGYLPVGFTLGSFDGNANRIVRVLNRDGSEIIHLNRSAVTINSDEVLSRLIPLSSQQALKMYLPTPVAEPSTLATKSFLTRFMLQVFGVSNTNSKINLDSDILAIMEYEIEDFTNEVITFARGNGPFKVAEATETTLGFYGLDIGRK